MSAPEPTPVRGAVVLVPVKAFSEAKRRLSSAVDPAQRATLARAMAHKVVQAAAPLPVAVVCDDPEVTQWAKEQGTIVLHEPGIGLNAAVATGVEQLRLQGFTLVIIAHSDLPLAVDLAKFAATTDAPGSVIRTEPSSTTPTEGTCITIVPDRHHNGTNVLVVPTDVPFEFSYGPGSFGRHVKQALASGRSVRIVVDRALSSDVDWPSDLVAARRANAWPVAIGR